MHIVVKILKGSESKVTVSAGHSVADLKQILWMQTSMPVDEQKLVFKGKTLADDKHLSDYKISDGDKLFLFQKKKVELPSTLSFPSANDCSWEKLQAFLQRHFTPKDAEKVLTAFQKEFNNKIENLSLDDIERIAAWRLQPLR